MDLRVLILVFDLSAAVFHVLAGILQFFDFEFEAPGFERQIARRFATGIEVLVPPLHRRREHAHSPPLDAPLGAIFTFRPEERITRAGEHNDMRASAMAMGFFIFADGKFRHMSAHGVIDELEQRRAIVAAALFVILGLKAHRSEIKFDSHTRPRLISGPR